MYQERICKTIIPMTPIIPITPVMEMMGEIINVLRSSGAMNRRPYGNSRKRDNVELSNII